MSIEKLKPTSKNTNSLFNETDTDIPYTTTQKEDFVWPKQSTGPSAKRNKLLRKFLFNEIGDQYIKQITEEDKNVTMEKNTTYTASYLAGKFVLKDITENVSPEDIAKYPLYSDQALSIYVNLIKNIKSKKVSNDPQAIFRKYSYFSKPFYAELEEY